MIKFYTVNIGYSLPSVSRSGISSFSSNVSIFEIHKNSHLKNILKIQIKAGEITLQLPKLLLRQNVKKESLQFVIL